MIESVQQTNPHLSVAIDVLVFYTSTKRLTGYA